MYFCGRQPAGSVLHGSVNMESLLINVNAPIIHSISKIMNQLAEGTADVSLMPQTTASCIRQKVLEETQDFWAIKPVMATDIPIPLGYKDYGISYFFIVSSWEYMT